MEGADVQKSGKRYRRWSVTVNNYTDQDIATIKLLPHLRYCIIGKEVASTGTPHLQCYIECTKAVTFSMMKKGLPAGSHIEQCKGNQEQNIKYCSKENNFEEVGTKSKQGKRTDIIAARDIINNGGSVKDVIDNDATCTYQAISVSEKMIKYVDGPKYRHVDVIWIYGPSGCGKTRMAMEMTDENVWISTNGLKWFDGYRGQKHVIIDDIRNTTCEFNILLRYLDRYRARVEVKGSSVPWVPNLIILTSPGHPRDLFDIKGENMIQLLRRITEIRHIDHLGVMTVESRSGPPSGGEPPVPPPYPQLPTQTYADVQKTPGNTDPALPPITEIDSDDSSEYRDKYE